MKKVAIISCILLGIALFTTSYGQKGNKKVKITGFVQDVAATPVAGAMITVDGTKSGILTDSKGYYKIKVSSEATKIGVFTKTNSLIEELINGRKTIDFTFPVTIPYETAIEGEKPVDIGYEKVKKKDLLGPVGQVDATKFKYSGYTNIYELIRGKVPGVVVKGNSIMIRSASSLNLDTEPMFVVDGVPVSSIDNIDPQNVKSISVLKGSAASIYGTRGSNGVILINLLKGTDK